MADKTSILFQLGVAGRSRVWPDYLVHGFDASDVPYLLAMVADERLHEADAESDECWAPLHAWRVLGQLSSVEAVEPLLAQFESLCDDDWALEELPVVMGMIGEPSIAPLAAYLNRREHSQFARVMAADGLKHVAERWPACRDSVVEALSNYLSRPDETCLALNALVVGNLIDLDAKETIDVVRELYANGLADIMHVGDIEDVEIEFGLRDSRDTPKPNYFQASVFSNLPTPDDDDLYAVIDRFFVTYGSDESILDVSELDGFLAAIVCAPILVKPSRWLPAIWGDGRHEPKWQDMDEAQTFLSSVTIVYNDVVQQLSTGIYEALFLEREVEGRVYTIVDEWCAGFFRGLKLWPALPSQERVFMEGKLEPIRLFADEEGFRRLDDLTEERIEEMQQRINPAVQDLYGYFSASTSLPEGTVRREAPKVGRNDPCPCGSGKKYKKCCLH
jgi:uncharacterized protein